MTDIGNDHENEEILHDNKENVTTPRAHKDLQGTCNIAITIANKRQHRTHRMSNPKERSELHRQNKTCRNSTRGQQKTEQKQNAERTCKNQPHHEEEEELDGEEEECKRYKCSRRRR